MGDDVRIKGTNFLSFLDALEVVEGPDVRARALERIEGEPGELVRAGALISSGWYPASHYSAVLDAAERAVPGSHDLLMRVARQAVIRDLGGIYRILTFMLTPQSVLKRAPRLFGTYYEGAKMEIRQAVPERADLAFHCPGFDRRLWTDLHGGTYGVLEACGAKELVLREKTGGRDGDERMTLVIEWG